MEKKATTIKDLKVRDARAVKGGKLACASGQHYPDVVIVTR